MENKKIDLTSKLYETRLDPNKEVAKQPVLLSVVQRMGTQTVCNPIFTLGDLSLIQGRQKSKKTFFTSVICTAILNEYSFIDKLSPEPPEGTTIVVFDTEQSDYYGQITNKRIHKMSGGVEFYYFALRDSNPKERQDILEHFLSTHKGKISYILIDGIVDLLYDFNDLKECSELVQWVMRITKEYNVHCSCILHENNADGKARGHVGTMLAQKAETVLRIKKNEKQPSRSTITGVDTRGVGFIPFDIEIDHEGIPHLLESEETKELF
jgi:hypothetical protein